MIEKTRFCRQTLALVLAALALPACGDGEGSDVDPDASTDTDTDTDGDSDTDTDSDFDCDASVDDKYRWHAFYGHDVVDDSTDSGRDEGGGLAVDASGNTYVTGVSFGTWTGPGGEEPLHAPSGGAQPDLFVMKLDSDGAYRWHTFLGEIDGADYGRACAVDEGGNVYVTGQADHPWTGPGGEGPLHAHTGGGYDLFVVKLDANGAYQWHTYFGPGEGASLGTDGDGNLYVSGSSEYSWDGPSGEGPLHPFTSPTDDVETDSFVLKLDSNGGYQWHTFYGSIDHDDGYRNAIDASGNVYVAGMSAASWTGPSGEIPLHGFGTGHNIFILKLAADGAYQWHAFFDVDEDYPSIAVDEGSGLYLTGLSRYSWTGPSGEAPLHAFSYGEESIPDLFVLKLDTSGNYQWHTFYGSVLGDAGQSLAIHESGELYVMGASVDTWNGPGGECPLGPYGDIVVLKLDADGAYGWHTFYGDPGEGLVYGSEIAVGNGGELYVTGGAEASWDGPAGESPLHAYAGGEDIFVLKLAP